jgi:hypothetical protein
MIKQQILLMKSYWVHSHAIHPIIKWYVRSYGRKTHVAQNNIVDMEIIHKIL